MNTIPPPIWIYYLLMFISSFILLAPEMTMKMTKPETTTAAPASNYQTESDGSTKLTRSVEEIAEKIEAEQHYTLSSAITLGKLSKNIITKPI
jgi:hypothetical protein